MANSHADPNPASAGVLDRKGYYQCDDVAPQICGPPARARPTRPRLKPSSARLLAADADADADGKALGVIQP
jgi:hypothetical protein